MWQWDSMFRAQTNCTAAETQCHRYVWVHICCTPHSVLYTIQCTAWYTLCYSDCTQHSSIHSPWYSISIYFSVESKICVLMHIPDSPCITEPFDFSTGTVSHTSVRISASAIFNSGAISAGVLELVIITLAPRYAIFVAEQRLLSLDVTIHTAAVEVTHGALGKGLLTRLRTGISRHACVKQIKMGIMLDNTQDGLWLICGCTFFAGEKDGATINVWI